MTTRRHSQQNVRRKGQSPVGLARWSLRRFEATLSGTPLTSRAGRLRAEDGGPSTFAALPMMSLDNETVSRFG